MPNTPVRVCAGVFLLEEKHSLTPEEYVLVQELFGPLGLVQPVESRLLGLTVQKMAGDPNEKKGKLVMQLS